MTGPSFVAQHLEPKASWRSADVADAAIWTVELTPADHRELDAALAVAKARSGRLPDIGRDAFPLDGLAAKLQRIEDELVEGRGFVRLSRLDVGRYAAADLTWMYWGIGAHLGRPWPQNKAGDPIVDVTDRGRAATDLDRRDYEMGTIALSYHTDAADLVGLLCLGKARFGGLSCIANAVAIYHDLVRSHPRLATLLHDELPHDFRGEEPAGRPPFYMFPVFTAHKGRLFIRFIPEYIRSSQRHAEAPRLSREAAEALEAVEAMASDPQYNVYMDLEPGEMQFINNYHVVHGRTAYIDDLARGQKRHLQRLWLEARLLKDRPRHFRRGAAIAWARSAARRERVQ